MKLLVRQAWASAIRPLKFTRIFDDELISLCGSCRMVALFSPVVPHRPYHLSSAVYKERLFVVVGDRVSRRSGIDYPFAINVDDSELDAVQRLLTALERKDATSSTHVKAVGLWCRRIARTLGLPQSQVRFVERCGTLHDVGKLFTPTAILIKPASLTPEEWQRMQAHAAEGADLLESIPSLRVYANVVRSHHERVDGKGYPNRLAAVDIPYEAKIIAIADAFDAMIATRPYRSALSPLAALDELKRVSGAQFDASLIDAFVDIAKPIETAIAGQKLRYG